MQIQVFREMVSFRIKLDKIAKTKIPIEKEITLPGQT